MNEIELLRAALVALYGIETGDVTELEAGEVMFEIDAFLAVHDAEWRESWHTAAIEAEKSTEANQRFRRRCRSDMRGEEFTGDVIRLRPRNRALARARLNALFEAS